MKPMSLSSFTKLVLAVSAIVQAIMGVAGLLLPDLTRSLLSPTQGASPIDIRYIGAFYAAGAVAAGYALLQNHWIAARTYLASAFVLILLFVLVTLLGLLTPPGLKPIAWAYVFLSVLYLPAVAWTMWKESKAHA